MAKRDYYEVLGIGREAGEDEIKKAFRRLARELHPDVNTDDPDAEEKFKEAAEAYEVLSDAERRRTYDAFGHDGLRSGGWQSRASSGGLEDILQAFFGGGGSGGGGGGGSFGDLFGFGGGRGGPAGGGDVGAEIEISLAEVVSGASRQVTYKAVDVCDHCRGNAAEPGTAIKSCPGCEGSGQVRRLVRTSFGQMVQQIVCQSCDGAGKIPETPCRSCRGQGRIAANKRWDVDVPAGIESGQRIRISGAGHVGEAGGRTGDLYVQVKVGEDERFHREGGDLVTVAEMSVAAAMLGATIGVPTLDGEEDVEVQPGAQHGDSIKLSGRGLPTLRSPRRGDQFVVIKLVVPQRLSPEQREIVERLNASLEPRNFAGEGVFSRVRRAFR